MCDFTLEIFHEIGIFGERKTKLFISYSVVILHSLPFTTCRWTWYLGIPKNINSTHLPDFFLLLP